MRIWPRPYSRIVDRTLSGLVALGLGVLVWLYARSRDPEALDNVPIPVEISLPPGQADRFDLEIAGPAQVPVSFRGPPSRIRELRTSLQRGQVRVAVTVVVPEDFQNESRYLDTVRVDAADVHPPPGVTPLIMEGRNRIPVVLHRLVERRLPVRLDPPPEERVSQVAVEPTRVLVRGPQDILDRVRSIPTQPFLPSTGDSDPAQEVVITRPVSLVREMDGRPVRTAPAAVTVRLTYRPQQKLYELPAVPVRFLCPADFPLQPKWVDEPGGTIRLRVWGPVAEAAPTVVAFIDLTRRKFTPGLYPEEPLRLQLPHDCQLAQEPPRAGAFRLEPVPTGAPRNKDLANP
jgi:hypothetical protein